MQSSRPGVFRRVWTWIGDGYTLKDLWKAASTWGGTGGLLAPFLHTVSVPAVDLGTLTVYTFGGGVLAASVGGIGFGIRRMAEFSRPKLSATFAKTTFVTSPDGRAVLLDFDIINPGADTTVRDWNVTLLPHGGQIPLIGTPSGLDVPMTHPRTGEAVIALDDVYGESVRVPNGGTPSRKRLIVEIDSASYQHIASPGTEIVVTCTDNWGRQHIFAHVLDRDVGDWQPLGGSSISEKTSATPTEHEDELAAEAEAREQGWRDEAEEFRRLATTFWGTLGDIYDTEAFSHYHYGFPDIHSAVRTAWWPEEEHELIDQDESSASSALDKLVGRVYHISGQPPGFTTSREAHDFDVVRQSMATILKRWQRVLEGDDGRSLRLILRDQLDGTHTCTAKLLWYVDKAKAQKIGSHPKFGPHKALRAVLASLDPCTGPSGDLRPLSVEGLGTEHMKRLDSFRSGPQRQSKEDIVIRVLLEGGLVSMGRDLMDGTASFSINPDIREDVVAWRRDFIRDLIQNNPHLKTTEFFELFRGDAGSHEVDLDLFSTAQTFSLWKLCNWERGNKLTIWEDMVVVVEEVVGPLTTRSIIIQKKESATP